MRRSKLTVIRMFWMILILLICGKAYAATQGTLDNTSTGTANVSLNIAKLITVRNTADLALGTYSGIGALQANQNISVSVNMRAAGSRLYRVTATGSCTGNSPSNAFNVSNGTSLIPYSVFFNTTTGTAGEVALTAGVVSSTLGNANFPLTVTTDNANYHVVFSQTNLQEATVGNYTGVLTLLFAPQ